MEQNGYANERRGYIDAAGDFCPFIGLLHDQCYYTKMTSLTIQKVLAFCAQNYRDCHLYKTLTHIDDRQEIA